ncbi:methionine ABC transporter ATP-binding protein [Streptomyces sp. HNM0575]|uniref:methionine ABC transporter ATP-binding protein n=1 Tax=Streptomyces sp. HNM0575 TaxID=2716338 RepID=UPI0032169BF3
MIRTEHLSKTFFTGGTGHRVLEDVDLEIAPGTIGAVVGPSGAGKSTLARCVNLLERPTGGRVHIAGVDVTDMREGELRRARRAIGTVFQSPNLLHRRTAAENVALPLRYLGVTERQQKERVHELLERVGIADKAGHYPRQLSGGQRQRVGIARALALRPKVLLSDEATSGLDPGTTNSVLRLLRELSDDLGLAVLLITHEMDVVREIADTAALLHAGRVVDSGEVGALVSDAHSVLGNALLPDRPAVPGTASGTDGGTDGGTAHTVWRLTYEAADTPPDWLTSLGSRHGLSVGLLSATVEGIAGRAAGRAVVTVPSQDAPALLRALHGWGIQAEERPLREANDRTAPESSNAAGSDAAGSDAADRRQAVEAGA